MCVTGPDVLLDTGIFRALLLEECGVVLALRDQRL